MRYTFSSGAFAVLALAGCSGGSATSANDPAVQAMLDRIAVEDLITEYYENFGGDENHEFGDYYTEDAVFDVNGLVYEGREEIVGLYDTMDETNANPPAQRGTFHMLLTNPVVKVEGNEATVKLLWTGIMNDPIDAPPQFVEQGREYDLLVKQDGKWLIKKRVVIADSGLPEMFKATYAPRKDLDIRSYEPPAD